MADFEDPHDSPTSALLGEERSDRHARHGGSLVIEDDGHTYSYSYGPPGVSGLLQNKVALACAGYVAIGGFTFGYDQGVIANVLVMPDFLGKWGEITAWEKGSMTAVLELGALFGALAAGVLADRYSRRYAICFACIVFIIGSLFQCAAQSFSHLFIGRAVGGFGVGALSMLCPLYMAEISPPEIRGSLMALEQAFELDSVQSGQSIEKDGLIVRELKDYKRLFLPAYRDRTMIGILIMVFQQWSGINALLYYGPTLLQSIGLSGDKVSLLASGGIGIVQAIAVFPTIMYIDQWGRKPLLRYGSIVMTTSHFLVSLLVWRFQDNWPLHPTAAWSAVGCIYIFTAAYGISFGPVAWVLPSEVFPLSMRSKGVALSTASNWFNNFFIGLITPMLMEVSPATTFMIFSTACFMAYLWSTYRVPETANASLEEIDAVFRSSAGQETQALKEQIEQELGLTQLIQSLRRDT
ncbi:hypothetical protein PC9H_008164 [Pleurotus ostreatus]|uniref:Major facilitator superfamily (MFS) profile domain-containing protein n=1 Tax=Pleurotus ostreatus TaxID=5322 RepID=A0A8H7DUY3_PLEOS|nr:uncharacterized protein PC9H_008164 [Pleurotus ostreatus]KAF7428928.1 hypothetical protein PC9H_008164 [Pleurotus ostreatus]